MDKLNNKIIIKKSYIEENNGLFRMITPIIENGKEYNVYVEVEKAYSKYLCTERADAQVFLTLPVAVREGYDIYSETPVTEMFLHSLNEILIPHLAIGDSRIHHIKIIADTDNALIGGRGVGTGISCGVDSLYTVHEYTQGVYPDMDLTHLTIISANVELWNTVDSNLSEWVNQHVVQFERYKAVCEYTGLPLVKVYSNYFHYLCSKDYNRSWSIYHHSYVHTYITIGAVLALKKLWKTYYFSSATDFTHFTLANNMTSDASHYELLLMEALSVPDFFCFSGGAQYDRADKTIALMKYPLAYKVLHPCHSDGKKNCTKPWCGKCLRALLIFDYYNKLDLFSEVFDVDTYRKNHFQYIYWMVEYAHMPENEPYFKRLYFMMNEKYPNEVKRAENNYKWNKSPTVPKEQFLPINRCYNILLDLLKSDEPAVKLFTFFKQKGVKKLYVSGQSNFVDAILTFMAKSDMPIEAYNYKTAKFSECDGFLIADALDSVIENRKTILKKTGIKDEQIYTIMDLHSVIKS